MLTGERSRRANATEVERALSMDQTKCASVPVTLSVENWAKIVAAVGQSHLLTTDEKYELNSLIWTCVAT
jgi:hypothetical protein